MVSSCFWCVLAGMSVPLAQGRVWGDKRGYPSWGGACTDTCHTLTIAVRVPRKIGTLAKKRAGERNFVRIRALGADFGAEFRAAFPKSSGRSLATLRPTSDRHGQGPDPPPALPGLPHRQAQAAAHAWPHRARRWGGDHDHGRPIVRHAAARAEAPLAAWARVGPPKRLRRSGAASPARAL